MVALALAATVTACHPEPRAVSAQRLAPLGPGEIRRIAVLPFASGERVARGEGPVEGQEPLPEPPADTVERAVSRALGRLPTWKLSDDLVTHEALRKVCGEVRAPSPDEAAAVGRLLGVDAVLGGTVIAFEERIGAEYAAKRPARVDFEVELIGIPSGTSVWRAEYAERQRALLDDLWNVLGFVRAKGRWVRAGQLAQLGAEQIASQMHLALYGDTASPVPTARRTPVPTTRRQK